MKLNVEKLKQGGSTKPKIHIKKENIGKFTATKKATGKTTEELTHSKNPITKKRAIFAQNSKRWKHKEGGTLEFINELIQEFKNGGTIQKFQEGGEVMFKTSPVDTTNYSKQSLDILNKYKHLNFVQRMTPQSEQNLRFIPKSDAEKKALMGGSYGTMLMGYNGNDKEGYFMYPNIVQKKGENKLTLLNPYQAWEYAKQTGEYIPIGKDRKFAEYITNPGYKQLYGGDTYNRAMEDYKNYTNLQVTNSPLKNKQTNYTNYLLK